MRGKYISKKMRGLFIINVNIHNISDKTNSGLNRLLLIYYIKLRLKYFNIKYFNIIRDQKTKKKMNYEKELQSYSSRYTLEKNNPHNFSGVSFFRHMYHLTEYFSHYSSKMISVCESNVICFNHDNLKIYMEKTKSEIWNIGQVMYLFFKSEKQFDGIFYTIYRTEWTVIRFRLSLIQN